MPQVPLLLRVYPVCSIVVLSRQNVDFHEPFSFWNGTLIKTLLGTHPTSGAKLIFWDSLYPIVLEQAHYVEHSNPLAMMAMIRASLC